MNAPRRLGALESDSDGYMPGFRGVTAAPLLLQG